MPWSKGKRLHGLDTISNFSISRGAIKFNITEDRNPISIIHSQDFIKFPRG